MIYLDHAATTPLDDRVKQVMLPYLEDSFHNPSSPYQGGVKIRADIEEARAKVSKVVNARPEDIIFSSGGTESANMAIKGVAWNMSDRGRHLITSEIEHHAVLDTFKWLEKQGFKVTYLPVDGEGRVDPEQLKKSIQSDTILISVMWANNETGTIQPIRELGAVAAEHDILFHTDAVQTVGTEEIDVEDLDVDLISFSSHKIYGPKSAGALFCRSGVNLTPLIHGGSQENQKRGGTESVANIIGFGMAAELLTQERTKRAEHLQTLRNIIWDSISEIEDVRINSHLTQSIPGIINLSVPGIEGEALLILLDQSGIQASQSSACTTIDLEPSHVLKAIGVPNDHLRGSIRLSPGKDSSRKEILEALKTIKQLISRLRNNQ